ncbi:hypothetical protein SmJEL517_g02969 [Synchytrium microbalum]|uniref:EF-hand domain-containing protein n=1 Tax=Synchytrium microbalum TaxID=1806994 RepID=A0A507C3U1_9FUNG|nr:uncharacterized protein SmJEL517_g02969 [Synchytrium microbalum]TPX34342.1 hypothetical protein SmJEL517_g02969 [Synchytrium microbalum]
MIMDLVRSMSARKQKKKRAVRQNSNVFAMFDQKQIGEFKEAFSMIDHDNDGFIDKEDLNDMLSSLGQKPTDEYLDEMVSEAPGSINFTMFLTLMGEKLSGTDSEHEILQAFECFDERKTGFINAELFREYMTSMGDRFTDEEVDIMFKGAPVDPATGNFNYRTWTRVLKHVPKQFSLRAVDGHMETNGDLSENGVVALPDSGLPQKMDVVEPGSQEPLSMPERVIEQRLLPIYASLCISSFIGVLIRIALLDLHAYTGAPVVSIVYPQIVGCIIIGWTNANKNVLIDQLSGSITTFSSWSLSTFSAFADLGLTARSGGYDFLAGVGVAIIIIGMSLISVPFGEHIAKVVDLQALLTQDWQSPTFRFHPVGFRTRGLSVLDRTMMGLALLLWVMLVLIGIFVESGRSVVFACILAPLGTLLRYRLAVLNVEYPRFPAGTFTVNMIGTFLLGLFYIFSHGMSGISSISSSVCSLLAGLSDGFCGCLTTISTFAVELRTMKLRDAYIYGITSIIGGQIINLIVVGSATFTHGQPTACLA